MAFSSAGAAASSFARWRAFTSTTIAPSERAERYLSRSLLVKTLGAVGAGFEVDAAGVEGFGVLAAALALGSAGLVSSAQAGIGGASRRMRATRGAFMLERLAPTRSPLQPLHVALPDRDRRAREVQLGRREAALDETLVEPDVGRARRGGRHASPGDEAAEDVHVPLLGERPREVDDTLEV